MSKKTLGTGTGGKSFVSVGAGAGGNSDLVLRCTLGTAVGNEVILVLRCTLGAAVPRGGSEVILVLRCTLGAAVDAIRGEEELELSIVVFRNTSGRGVNDGVLMELLLDNVSVSVKS